MPGAVLCCKHTWWGLGQGWGCGAHSCWCSAWHSPCSVPLAGAELPRFLWRGMGMVGGPGPGCAVLMGRAGGAISSVLGAAGQWGKLRVSLEMGWGLPDPTGSWQRWGPWHGAAPMLGVAAAHPPAAGSPAAPAAPGVAPRLSPRSAAAPAACQPALPVPAPAPLAPAAAASHAVAWPRGIGASTCSCAHASPAYPFPTLTSSSAALQALRSALGRCCRP